jgi:hypothetical protein
MRGVKLAKKTRVYRDLELEEVMTSQEVVQLFGLSHAAVRNACKRGSIPARKSAGVWLVKRADAVKKWGQVKSKSGEVIDLAVSF